MGYIKGEERNQTILFPESIDDYISDDNSARVIDEYVKQLDMEELGFKKAVCSSTGRPPYDPKDMLKLYLYGYLNRIRSSRRLEHEAARNIEVIWLLKKLKPDFKTIADFRKDNKRALKAGFRNFTKLCNGWGLFGKELVAIDGSKFRACNSKKNNYNAKKLERHIKYIDEKIDAYLQEMEAEDQAESFDRKPSAEEINKRLQELRDRKKKCEDFQEQLVETGDNEVSTTDPDARQMSNNNNGLDLSYNVQTTVDAKHKLVADFKVTCNPNDLGELDNMALRAKRLFGGQAFEVLADKGYYAAEDLKKCVANHITPYVSKQSRGNRTGDKEYLLERFTYDAERNLYICPAGKELVYIRERKKNDKVIGYEYSNRTACRACKDRERCTTSDRGRLICRHIDQDFLDEIDLQTKLNKDKYKQRQMIIEHVFGTIKRTWGAYYFLTKKKFSVQGELSLSFLAYNLRRVINILGVKEMLARLRERRKLILAY